MNRGMLKLRQFLVPSEFGRRVNQRGNCDSATYAGCVAEGQPGELANPGEAVAAQYRLPASNGPLARRSSYQLITGWPRFDSWMVHHMRDFRTGIATAVRFDSSVTHQMYGSTCGYKQTGLSCALCESGRTKNIYLADPGPIKFYGSDRRHLRRGLDVPWLSRPSPFLLDVRSGRYKVVATQTNEIVSRRWSNGI